MCKFWCCYNGIQYIFYGSILGLLILILFKQFSRYQNQVVEAHTEHFNIKPIFCKAITIWKASPSIVYDRLYTLKAQKLRFLYVLSGSHKWKSGLFNLGLFQWGNTIGKLFLPSFTLKSFVFFMF